MPTALNARAALCLLVLLVAAGCTPKAPETVPQVPRHLLGAEARLDGAARGISGS